MVNASRSYVIFETVQDCRQMNTTSCRSILHAAKASQMPYNENYVFPTKYMLCIRTTLPWKNVFALYRKSNELINHLMNE